MGCNLKAETNPRKQCFLVWGSPASHKISHSKAKRAMKCPLWQDALRLPLTRSHYCRFLSMTCIDFWSNGSGLPTRSLSCAVHRSRTSANGTSSSINRTATRTQCILICFVWQAECVGLLGPKASAAECSCSPGSPEQFSLKDFRDRTGHDKPFPCGHVRNFQTGADWRQPLSPRGHQRQT